MSEVQLAALQRKAAPTFVLMDAQVVHPHLSNETLQYEVPQINERGKWPTAFMKKRLVSEDAVPVPSSLVSPKVTRLSFHRARRVPQESGRVQGWGSVC